MYMWAWPKATPTCTQSSRVRTSTDGRTNERTNNPPHPYPYLQPSAFGLWPSAFGLQPSASNPDEHAQAHTSAGPPRPAPQPHLPKLAKFTVGLGEALSKTFLYFAQPLDPNFSRRKSSAASWPLDLLLSRQW